MTKRPIAAIHRATYSRLYLKPEVGTLFLPPTVTSQTWQKNRKDIHIICYAIVEHSKCQKWEERNALLYVVRLTHLFTARCYDSPVAHYYVIGMSKIETTLDVNNFLLECSPQSKVVSGYRTHHSLRRTTTLLHIAVRKSSWTWATLWETRHNLVYQATFLRLQIRPIPSYGG